MAVRLREVPEVQGCDPQFLERNGSRRIGSSLVQITGVRDGEPRHGLHVHFIVYRPGGRLAPPGSHARQDDPEPRETPKTQEPSREAIR